MTESAQPEAGREVTGRCWADSPSPLSTSNLLTECQQFAYHSSGLCDRHAIEILGKKEGI